MASRLLETAALLLFIQASSCKASSDCPIGHYCLSDGSVPVPCSPGQHRSRYQDPTRCYSCSDGYYQDKSGQEYCMECPVGHKCPAPKTQAIPCPPGTYGRGYLPDRVICSKCLDGHYQDQPGQTDCIICPEGHSCRDPATLPVPCPPGTKSWGQIQNRVRCLKCLNGHYQDKPGQYSCLECPRGHSCQDPAKPPSPCPPGTHSRGHITDRISCSECSKGQYQDKPGQEDCLPCPVGRYCPTPKNRAIPCPAGTVSYSQPGYRMNCVTCSNGWYQDKTGQTNCLLCPEGHECPSPKNRSIPCPQGYQNGYYRYKPYLMNCLACDAGSYQNRSEQTRCNTCPKDHYCPLKESGPVPCPPGYTNPSRPTDRISCVRCSPGQCLTVTPPVVCEAGSFLDSNTGACKPCEAGQYQIHPGQSSCQVCPEGYYCPTTTGKPIPCPMGTYSTIEIAVRTACLPCSTGTYQVKEGQNACLTCPTGHFCSEPSADPVPCPPGSYSTTSTTDRTKCLPCSSRYYQDQSGQQECKICPAGYLCPRSDISPQQCPPNTYSTTDLTDRSKCLPCSAGWYQDQCGQEECKRAFADGTTPTQKPGLTCPSLNTSEVVSSSHCIELNSGGVYSGSAVRLVEGNDGVMYPVVKISQEHRSPGENITDDDILVSTAIAFDKMATFARFEGETIAIASAFRSYERQVYFYNCYITKKCNNGNYAKEPGKSNHGSGVALDLNTNCGNQTNVEPPPRCSNSTVYMWLKSNGHKFGFIRTVQSEPWHWEYKGGPVAGPSSFS